MEVRCRGFAGQLLCRAYIALDITGHLITAQRLQRKLLCGFGLRERIRGRVLLGHKLRRDQHRLGNLRKGV